MDKVRNDDGSPKFSKTCEGCEGTGRREKMHASHFDPGYYEVGCEDCAGFGSVPALCADCEWNEAELRSVDGVLRCLPCAREIAAGAAAVLDLIASRSTSVTVDRIVSGALRIASGMAGRS